MAVHLMTEASVITKAIESISKRGAKLDADIQVAACSIVAHIEKHGDITLAERLITAMPKGSRKLALVEYMLAFAKIRLLDKTNPDDAEAIASGRVFAFAKDKTTDIEGAIATAWHEFKKEKEVLEAFDVQAAVQAVLKRVASARKAGTKILHEEALEQLVKIAG